MMPAMPAMPTTLPRCLRHGLYPLLLLATLAYLAFELHQPPTQLGRHYPLYLTAMVLLLAVAEARWPLRHEWRMTRATWWRRDLPFLVIGGATLGSLQALATHLITTGHATRGTWLAGLPLVPGVLVTLLLGDLLWYTLHRCSHEARGPLGRWLWRVHCAHHLPGQVYVLMHAVAHPINTAMVRVLLTVPFFLLGLSPEVVFTAAVITGFQGLVSHWNLDSRAGGFNHVLAGTELHRLHHSADPAQAGNYGAVTSLWDRCFGTCVVPSDRPPAALGVTTPHDYPADTDLLALLGWPLWRRPRPARQPSTVAPSRIEPRKARRISDPSSRR